MKTLILAVIRRSLMFTAVRAFSLAYPAKANLITNPGFETGDLTGWNQTGFAVDNSNPHSGLYVAFTTAGDFFQTYTRFWEPPMILACGSPVLVLVLLTMGLTSTGTEV